MKAEWKKGRPPKTGWYAVCYINGCFDASLRRMFFSEDSGWCLHPRLKHKDQTRVYAWDYLPELPADIDDKRIRELERIREIERDLEHLKKQYAEAYGQGVE